MKQIFPAVALLLCLLAACKKSSNNPGGNGGNGGGGSDTLSVSNFSPAYPYNMDVVTITGTGFNTDKTKDSVLLADNGNYQRAYLTISSATTTQLKVVIPPDSILNILGTCGNDSRLNIYVMVNGKQVYVQGALHLIPFKLFDVTNAIADPVTRTEAQPRPGDSLHVNSIGLTQSGNTFSIDGLAINLPRVDSSCTGTPGYGRLPKSAFGGINNEDTTSSKMVSMTNGAGKSIQKKIVFYLSPVMSINQAYFDQTSYSLSALGSTGGKIRLHIAGANLKNDVDVHFYGPGIDSHNTLGVSGFPDSTAIDFGVAGLAANGFYYVALTANNTSYWSGPHVYATAGFSVTP